MIHSRLIPQRSQHFNQLTPAQAERLAILIEELGEAQQAVGKILRHGYDSPTPSLTPRKNRDDLERELGDVLAAITRLTNAEDLDAAAITADAEFKLKMARPYLHHQE